MPPSKTTSIPTDSPRGSYLVLLLIGVLGGLHLVTSFFPGISTWGIDYWSSFPVAARLFLAVILAVSFLPAATRRAQAAAEAVRRRKEYQVMGAVGLVLLFVVFRSRVYVYGDGYSFAGYFADGRLPEFTRQLATQVLELVAHWAVYRAVVMPLGGPVETSYVILGALAGLFSIWAIVRIARALVPGRDARRLIIAASVSSVSVVFWFGHVESYTLVNAAILWTLVFAVESQSHKPRIWAAWGMWVVAVAFHQLAVALLPALLWAHWRTGKRSWKGFSAPRRPTILGLGFLAWMIAATLYGMLRPGVFVPMLPTADSVYTAFSLHHLGDMINLALFLAPIGVAGLIIWLGSRESREAVVSTGHGVIAVGAASMWLFSFWVDPLIGAFRDWDLLAGFGIPLSIWGGAVIARRRDRAETGSTLWAMIAAVAVIHAGAFIATLQNPQGAMMRVDRLVREDVHYSGDFFRGKRLGPWAAVLQQRFGRNDLALDHLRHQVVLDPTSAGAWGNLAGAYRIANQPDSARIGYERAVAIDAKNLRNWSNLGRLRLDLGDIEGSREALSKAVALSDTAYDSRCLLAVVYLRLNRVDEARTELDEALRRYPGRFNAYYYHGALNEMLADTAAALRDYEKALELGGWVEEVYRRLCQLYQWTGQTQKAITAARSWGLRFSMSFEPPFLEGTSYLVASKFDSAAIALNRCLSLQPDHALATYYLATAYRNLGQPDQAKELALRASRLDTTLAVPYLELVYLAADAGDQAAARAAAREYVRRSPGDSAMPYLQQFLHP